MAAAQGMFTKLAIGSSLALTNRFDFQRCSMGKRQLLIDGNGLRGTLEKDISRIRNGGYRVGGGITFQPNAAELALLMPWILGANPSGTTYALADTTPTRYIQADQVVKVPAWAGCAVNRATFRASAGEPLTVDVDVIGQTEGNIVTTTYTEGSPGSAGTFPSINIDTATGPFIFTDLALTVGGVTYNAREFSLEVNNQIDASRFFNSLTLVSTVKTDRTITFRTTLPYGDAAAVYGSGAGGVAIVGTFTNGTVSCAFSMPAVAFPASGPEIPGRSELMLAIEGDAYHTGSSDSLTVTLDSTP